MDQYTDQSLLDFIDQARERHMSDERIKHKLVNAGWDMQQVADALTGDDLPVPTPPSDKPITYLTDKTTHPVAAAVMANSVDKSSHKGQPQQDSQHIPAATSSVDAAHPMSVVENLTPRGFEYKIFSVALVLALVALIFTADFAISSSDWNAMAFPLTVLIVTGPLALFLFMRLHRAELALPELHKDPSRRKVVQGIQLVTFLGVVIHTIILVYLLISGHYSPSSSGFEASIDSDSSPHASFVTDLLRWLVTVALAGGTFMYYWREDHRR